MPRARHYEDFQPEPVIAALAIAALGGFVPAIGLAGAWAGWWPVGPWWTRVAQAHGHAQLFGWATLFVFGVGFFFLPRMRGSPLTRPWLVPWIALVQGAGLAVRVGGQIAGVHGVMAAGAAVHLAGVALAVFLIGETARHGPPLTSRPGTRRVIPLMGPAFLSMAAAAVISTVVAFRGVVLEGRADRVVVELMMLGFLVPLILTMSVQTLPLFLRLPATNDRAVFVLSLGYLASLLARVGALALGEERFAEVALAGWGAVVIAFTALLDVITRSRSPWTADRVPWQDTPERRKPRPGMPDFGEYGRFEWAVRPAYAWLVLAGVLAVADACGVPVAPDAIRHTITVGVATLMIVGMAPRMLPGFSKVPLARPELVAIGAVLGNLAAATRVLPKVLPSLPAGATLLGTSGVFGLGAVLLLAWTLAPTLARSERKGTD